MNKEKYKNIILYLIEHMDEPSTARLQQMLYRLDFLSYRDRGETVTRADYYKFNQEEL